MRLRGSLLLGAIICAACFSQNVSAADPAAVCIAEKLEPSLALLDQLRGHDLDLGQARLVTHVFIGKRNRFKAVTEAMAAQGYIVDEISNTRLILKSWALVNDAWVRSIIPITCKAAADAHLTYDGWDVDVSADHIQASSN